MKYYEVEFTITPYSTDACDLVAAMAGEAGFETFEETETGLKGYVQQALFDETVLLKARSEFVGSIDQIAQRVDVRDGTVKRSLLPLPVRFNFSAKPCRRLILRNRKGSREKRKERR